VKAWLTDGVEMPPKAAEASKPAQASLPTSTAGKRDWTKFWPLTRKAFGSDDETRKVMQDTFGKTDAKALTDDEYEKMLAIARERVAA
jgi:hypothetical protein